MESVETVIPFSNTANVRYARPITGMQARFSMPYNAALAILHRRLRLSDYDDSAVTRPEIVALMSKVSTTALTGTEHTLKGYLELPCHTVITLKSGAVHRDVRYERRGEGDRPLSSVEIGNKFRDGVSRGMSLAQAEEVFGVIDRLMDLTKITELMSMLRADRSIEDLSV